MLFSYSLGPVLSYTDIRAVAMSSQQLDSEEATIISCVYGATLGDGGAGFFTYDPNCTVADDNINYLKPNNYDGRWIRLGFSSGGGGPTNPQNLAQTLAVGNITGGTDIEMTAGDAITASDNMVVVNANEHVNDDGYFGTPIDTTMTTASIGNIAAEYSFSIFGLKSTGGNSAILVYHNDQVKIGNNNNADPIYAKDLTTKQYVDGLLSALRTELGI